jgi:hypothetical protein
MSMSLCMSMELSSLILLKACPLIWVDARRKIHGYYTRSEKENVKDLRSIICINRILGESDPYPVAVEGAVETRKKVPVQTGAYQSGAGFAGGCPP